MRSLSDNLKWRSLIGALCLVASLFSLSPSASAEEVSSSTPAPASQSASTETEAQVRAPAQDETPRKEKLKTLSFEDELVEGATTKPELFYLFQKKNFNYKRLIKLRENFLPEMRKTSEDLQRVRSSN